MKDCKICIDITPYIYSKKQSKKLFFFLTRNKKFNKWEIVFHSALLNSQILQSKEKHYSQS